MSAPSTCFANTFPDQHALDYSGFNGTVCLVSHDQGFQLDIASCCATSTVRTFDACTEYCQVNDAQDFKQCVNGKVMNDTMLSPVCPEVVDGKLPDQEGAAGM